MSGSWLTAAELASELGRSVSTLRAWRCAGYGPRFVRRGTLILYRREAVEEWLREAEVANTIQARAFQRVSRVDAAGDEQCNIPGPGAAARSAASPLPTSLTTTSHRSSTRASLRESGPAVASVAAGIDGDF